MNENLNFLNITRTISTRFVQPRVSKVKHIRKLFAISILKAAKKELTARCGILSAGWMLCCCAIKKVWGSKWQLKPVCEIAFCRTMSVKRCSGYPIISIPIGLDSDGLPIALSLQHSQWKEGELIKWASAIEDLLHSIFGWRATPGYCNPLSKRLPVFE
jgi:hypothetical protein